MTEMSGHRGFEDVALDRREQILLRGEREAASVDGDEDVGGAVLALGHQALDQFVVVGFHDIDGDAGFLGEGIPQLLIGAVVARVVDVDFLRARTAAGS